MRKTFFAFIVLIAVTLSIVQPAIAAPVNHEHTDDSLMLSAQPEADKTQITVTYADISQNNLSMVRDFMGSGRFEDIGLYETESLGLLRYSNEMFFDLCEDEATPASLAYIKAYSTDELTKMCLEKWLNYLQPDAVYRYSSGALAPLSAEEDIREFNNAAAYTLTISSVKSITIYKYLGSKTPTTQPDIYLHPSATQVGAASFYYNCHAYSWCFNADTTWQGNSSLYRIGAGIISSFTKDLDGSPACYSNVLSNAQEYPSDIDASLIKVGDIITYYTDFDQQGGDWTLDHSATVIQTASNIEDIVVRSKWGFFGVYTHKLLDCPFYGGPVDKGNIHSNGSQLSVHRANSNHKTTFWYDPLGHKATCLYCPYIDKNKSDHFYTKVGKVYYCRCGFETTRPVSATSLNIPRRKEQTI